LTIWIARGLVVACLAAAVFDVPIPAASRDRVRVHLIDRSGSALVRGAPTDLTPDDAARIVAWDREERAAGDTVLDASFGAGVAFGSTAVDASASNLAGALKAALARNPTEIVLYSDGRADPADALLLCRARGVPVHVFAVGPASPRDARLARIAAPPDAAPGDDAAVEVTVESTVDRKLHVTLDGQGRDVEARAGVPAVVAFTVRPPARFKVRLEPEDDCPENNEAQGEVLARASKKRVLLLSARPPEMPDYEVTNATAFRNPQAYDAVVVDNVSLREPEMRALAEYVRRFGGGVVLLGGPQSYAEGRWARTPIEEISPLLALPPERLAVAFAMDVSGSMDAPGKLDAVVSAVERALLSLRPTDAVVYVAFSDRARGFTDPAELRKLRANGNTAIIPGLLEARQQLEQIKEARRHIFLLTDGETRETPDQLTGAFSQFRDIGLTVVGTDRPLPIGQFRKLGDWRSLEGKIEELMLGALETWRANPGPLAFNEPRHPALRGAPDGRPPRLNRTTPKGDAQVAARVADSPAVAFRQEGQGRVCALAFGFDFDNPALFRQCIEWAAGEGGGGLGLSIDPPVVRARGTAEGTRIQAAWQALPGGDGAEMDLEQVGSDAWEGRLPARALARPGTVFVRAGRARAAATIACASELAAIGLDDGALGRIVAETGGRRLRSTADLRRLPPPSSPGSRSGRPLFLVLAGLLYLVEMALTTFWKPR
jgi:hypothetical protein